MGSAYLGGQISSKFSGVFSKVFNSISSPILKNVLINSTSNAASGFLLSAGISFAYTKDFDQALKDGVKGAGYGLALGSALGVVQGFQYARGYDVNPWTGKRNDFFKGTWYSDRVLGNMFNTSDAFHSFPENVKAFQMDGVVTPLKGKDGVIVPILKIPGSYRGREGYFEFIKERDEMINHRFFRPNSK